MGPLTYERKTFDFSLWTPRAHTHPTGTHTSMLKVYSCTHTDKQIDTHTGTFNYAHAYTHTIDTQRQTHRLRHVQAFTHTHRNRCNKYFKNKKEVER